MFKPQNPQGKAIGLRVVASGAFEEEPDWGWYTPILYSAVLIRFQCPMSNYSLKIAADSSQASKRASERASFEAPGSRRSIFLRRGLKRTSGFRKGRKAL